MLENESEISIYVPHALAGFVDIIVQHQSQIPSHFRALPNSKVEIMFLLEGSEFDHFYIDSDKSGFLPNDSDQYVMAFSSQTQPVDAKFRRLNAMLAVMNPIAAMAILGVPAWEVKDIHFEPTTLDNLNGIQDSLNTLTTFQQRARCLENYLLQRLAALGGYNRALEKIRNLQTLYSDPHSAFNETQLSFDHIFYSTSHFNRICKDWLGVTYREYELHKRFRKAMYAISHKNQSLSEIAFDLGFYDQAHFTRTFKRFAGMAPMEYQNSHKGMIPEFVMIE